MRSAINIEYSILDSERLLQYNPFIPLYGMTVLTLNYT